MFKNDDLQKKVEEELKENSKSKLWEEEKFCFKAGLGLGLIISAGAFVAGLVLGHKAS